MIKNEYDLTYEDSDSYDLENSVHEKSGDNDTLLLDTSFSFHDYLVSASITFVISIYFILTTMECRYWGIIPLMTCGTLAGSDLIAWFRRRLDIFDPKALAAVFLYLTVFLAPLLHMASSQYGRDLYVLNWPEAFARMAIANLIGLIVYKWLQFKVYSKTSSIKTYWQIDAGRLIVWSAFFLIISLIAAIIIRIFFGGLIKIEGEVQISEEASGYTAYLSVLRMLGDPFVLLLMVLIIFNINQKNKTSEKTSSWMTVGILMFVSAFLQFILVGLRGSRSVILSTIIIIGIIIHFTLRRYTRKWIIIGMAVVFVFLYLYDFRKKAGLIGLQAFYDTQVRQSLSSEFGGYTFMSTLLGDLSRADLQALMIANLTTYKDEIAYQPVWGRTYSMAFLTFIPRAVWKDKPVGIKKDAGTAIQGLLRGRDTSTRQYGLAGEAMLNFGYVGIPVAFCLFGLIMGYFRKKLNTINISDARIYIFPLIILMLQNMVIQDSDNWIFALLRDGTLLFILICLSSFRYRLQDALQ